MARKHKRTAADERRNDPGPETRDLSAEEAALFEAARKAAEDIARTFELWVVIGKAVVAARARADRLGGGKTFRRILEQQRLSRVVPSATATRLELIMARLPEVMEWRSRLSPRQQMDWASPSSVIKRAKDAAGRPLFPKKSNGATTSHRPIRIGFEVALDAIEDHLHATDDDDHRAALVERIKQIVAPFEARLEVDEKPKPSKGKRRRNTPDDTRRKLDAKLKEAAAPLNAILSSLGGKR